MKMLFVTAAVVSSMVAAPALAADFNSMLQPAPLAYAEPANWTGFYAGVFGGVTSGPFEYSFVPAGGPSVLDISVNGGGGVGGVQVGADYQFNQFVVGAVADIALTNHRAELDLTIPGGGGLTLEAKSQLTYLGTVRARVGYAFENLLAYVHGGLAFGRTEASITAGGVALPGINAADRFGYTIGAGVEYQVTDNISLQTEYAYTAFGDESLVDVGPGLGNVNEALNFHTVKAGINFRF